MSIQPHTPKSGLRKEQQNGHGKKIKIYLNSLLHFPVLI